MDRPFTFPKLRYAGQSEAEAVLDDIIATVERHDIGDREKHEIVVWKVRQYGERVETGLISDHGDEAAGSLYYLPIFRSCRTPADYRTFVTEVQTEVQRYFDAKAERALGDWKNPSTGS